jgi:hypothetical protein
MCAIDMYVCYVHIYFGHVHMHAICHALYCHVQKVIYMLRGFHITAYMKSCKCYMPKLLHTHMIGVASSQSYMCHILILHWHHVLSGVAFHKIFCIDSTRHHDASRMRHTSWDGYNIQYGMDIHASIACQQLHAFHNC